MKKEAGFFLRSDVKLVKGAKRGALYDLGSGKVYSLNTEAVSVLEAQEESVDFWHQLVALGLANEFFAEERGGKQESCETRLDHKLKFAWLELTSRCNEDCIHCYGLFGRPIESEDNLSHQEWKDAISQLFNAGCSSIQFIGGEPFMYKGNTKGEDIFDLIKHAKSVGFEEIEVFTNGTYLTERRTKKLKELGVRLAVSLYSSEPVIHDAITQKSGSHKLTLDGIRRAVENEVPVRVGFIVMSGNQHTILSTNELFVELGIGMRQPDVIRPTGGGRDDFLQPDLEVQKQYGLMMEPNFRVSRLKFEKNKLANPCLDGKIAITSDGSVIPCIFSRERKVGSLRHNTLEEILEGNELHTVWENNKDHVLVCQDCEYRYACHDCRPLAYGSNKGRNFDDAPAARCTYNPYTGVWGEGVWRLDDDGQPNYLPLEGG